MHPETGTTILKILLKRVPLEATSIICDDGTSYDVRKIDWVNRDWGDDFDHFTINDIDDPDGQLLYTSMISKIIDPTDGRVVFDADKSDQRMPKIQIKPFGTRKS